MAVTTPESAIEAARAEAAAIYLAAQSRPDLAAVVANRITSAARLSDIAVARTTRHVIGLWRRTDPYSGLAVEQFTADAARVVVAMQDRVAAVHVESQIQQLHAVGIDVAATPRVPPDVRILARNQSATVTDDGMDAIVRDSVSVDVSESADNSPSVSVEYSGGVDDSPAVTVEVDGEDSTTQEIFNRPARSYRYERSRGTDEESANSIAENRIGLLVDGNAMLAQRLAEQQILEQAVDLDDRVIGYRRIIHPEVVTKTGVCGLCIAASDRIYSIKHLKPIHARCNCTVSAVTEFSDPGRELNENDLQALYGLAGGTQRDRLKRTRYQLQRHGELGAILVPIKGQTVDNFVLHPESGN